MGGKSAEGLHKGRQPGSRNRLTLATLALAEEGETPCTYALRIMRDDEQPPDVRLNAARIAAPYLHPKPQPEPRMVTFDLPEQIRTPAALLDAHTNVMRAVADGEMSLEDAKDLSAILDSQRRIIEISDLEARIVRLEQGQGK